MPAKPQSPREPLGKARIVLAVILLQTVVLFLFDARDYLSSMIATERGLNAAVIGAASERKFKDRTDALFLRAIVDTGVYGGAQTWAGNMASGMTLSRGDPHVRESALWQRIEVFWLAIWTMIYRMISAGNWLLVSVPMAIALVVDAVLGRERRKWQYSLTSPLKNETYTRIAGLTIVAVIYAPFALIPMPSWIIPIAVVVAVFAVGGQIRSTQKRV